MKKGLKRLVYSSIFVILCTSAAFGGWYLAKGAPTVQKEEQVSASGKMLSAHAEITTTYIYRFCGHSQSETREVSREEVSMNEDEFSDSNPGFVLEHFDEDTAVLVHRIDGYCSKHYILKLEENSLVLYRPQDKTGELTKIQSYTSPTDIEDKEALQVGKVFASYAEATAYITEMNKVAQETMPGFGNNG